MDELKPGTRLLGGQYTIVQFINAGGFGITYLARNALGRDVVIKECFPGSFCRRSQGIVAARSRAHEHEFAQIVRLFVQEAQSLSRLIHPNIVGVHQVFEDNNTAYMAIDYVEGRDLLDIIEHDRALLRPPVIVMMLKKLLGAVAFIHDNGMLHRDISPDNILIGRTGEPVLIDFGAARQQATRVGKAMSALRVVKDGYSPQEFYVSGTLQTPSSDLYAMAATFYHLISGEAPPNSQSRLVALAETGRDPYRPLAGRHEGFPPGFLEAVDAAVSVLPRDRIQSAREWLDRISLRPELKVVPLSEARTAGATPAPAPSQQAPGDRAPAAIPAAVRPRGSAVRRATLLVLAAIGGALAYAALTHAPDFFGARAPTPLAPVQVGPDTTSAPPGTAAPAPPLAPPLRIEAAAAAATGAGAFAEQRIEVAPRRLPSGARDAAAAPAEPPLLAEARLLTDGTVLVRQVKGAGWSLLLPFEVDAASGAAAAPVISRAIAQGEPLLENGWVAAGVAVLAVDEIAVTDQASIAAALDAQAAWGIDYLVQVPARIRRPGAAVDEDVTLAARARRDVALENGVGFRTEGEDGLWRTRITAIAAPEPGGLRPGDVVLRELVTGEALSASRTLEFTVNRLARAQRPVAVFEVDRGGERRLARMSLARGG